MVGQTVVFDGHTLNDTFYIGNVQATPPEFVVDTLDSVSDGVGVSDVRLGSSTVTVPLVVRPGVRPRAALSDLLSWLDVDGPRALELAEDDGYARMVVPAGVNMDDFEYRDCLTVEFTQVEPGLYGGSREYAIPSGGSLTFEVGGTYPAMPAVSAAAAQRDASTQLWGLTFDDVDRMRVELPTALATQVSIDASTRKVLVGNDVDMVTLDSDWPRLAPGTHTVRMDQGTGQATLTFRERCL